MGVVMNLLCAHRKRTGVGHYAWELAEHLSAIAAPGEFAPFPSRSSQLVGFFCRYMDRVEPGIRARHDQLLATRPPANGSIVPRIRWKLRTLRFADRARVKVCQVGQVWMQRQFRAALHPRRCELYHEPNHIPAQADVPTIVTIHDLSVLLHPEWHPADRLREYDRSFHAGLARTQHILTDLECIRQEVIQHLGVAPERVTCARIGVRSHLRPLETEHVQATLRRLGLPPRYLLYLGTIEPRKNVLALLRAYCDLPGSLRERWPLLLVGGWGWKTEEVATYYHDHARHRGVRQIGYLPDESLTAVYCGARALAFPTHYEGFGLPPVEMMACGGAVIAAPAEAVRETVGAKAHLVEADDLAGWRDALRRVVEDDDWWQSLRQGTVEVARQFTWERCAAETLQVYRRVLGKADRSTLATPQRRAG